MSDTRMRLDGPAEASTGTLVQQMTEQVSALVREELALARTETVEKGKRAGTGAGLLGGAGVLALYGVSTLLLTIGALLALAWPAWLAALTVMAVVFTGAAVAALVGKKQVEQAVPPAPTAAVASTKRDVDTVAAAVRDGRRG
ncbi:phage holin family protein [Couchioplanes caeruleus]|uniref:Superfamily III holin-X n=2 Tax=Couchioplanes caeruleus TaxID=56438 RepID=A0A1K0GFH3_9ACTN|nr:phage holin family protein [Couchioplanes caeruleus]OJF16010.1 hypothetical protein BG844_01915 [Couchioplanes caeruleus subsp. caeruleus]ROP27868.1 putative superfamily III holin-X [Couchioplanes caeruleus]